MGLVFRMMVSWDGHFGYWAGLWDSYRLVYVDIYEHLALGSNALQKYTWIASC